MSSDIFSEGVNFHPGGEGFTRVTPEFSPLCLCALVRDLMCSSTNAVARARARGASALYCRRGVCILF